MNTNPNTTPTQCPVCGATNTGAQCPNSIHPASRAAHAALAMDLPEGGEV